MIIEIEINGARVIVSGENLAVNVTETDYQAATQREPALLISPSAYPTEAFIRECLLQAAERHGDAVSTICRKIGMDTNFLKRVREGENFSVKTYQRVMDWLDAAERERAGEAA